MGLRRLGVRFAPIVLTGCTMLSGAASLEIGDNELAADDAGVTSPTPKKDSGIADAAPAPHSSSSTPAPDAARPPITPPPTDAGQDAAGGTADSGGPVTVTFTQTLVQGQQQLYGPFPAQAGTIFDARTTGTGDDDLFLAFGYQPTVRNNDCASDFDGPNEHCRRTVPSGGPSAYVLIDAWLDCSYTLTVTYVPP